MGEYVLQRDQQWVHRRGLCHSEGRVREEAAHCDSGGLGKKGFEEKRHIATTVNLGRGVPDLATGAYFRTWRQHKIPNLP
ncbi:unnamed protein product [Gongylonema pulchrum]|uniref:Uncharacterized protein n=1 Tax=Gongylonema pulchrum TaxID=637853 RepID=A0A183E247_9BILA|nr:unnamed protein product [Gongylonema pulchrum]